MFFVYAIRNENKEWYIGFTANLEARLKAHNDGLNRSTANHFWELIYYEAYQGEKAARDRERILKHDGRSRRALMDRIKTHLE